MSTEATNNGEESRAGGGDMTRVSFFRGQIKKQIGGKLERNTKTRKKLRQRERIRSKLHECKVILLTKQVF